MSEPRIPDTSNLHAVHLLKALSHFDYPQDPRRLPQWLHQTRPLQSLLISYCLSDATGRIALDCLRVLFDLIATRGDAVSPAVWDLLQVVHHDDVHLLADTFLDDSHPRLTNTLAALMSALCRCGQRLPSLSLWCFAYIQALEDTHNYSVLLSVPQPLVRRLLQAMLVPHGRPLLCELLGRFLYPMTSPQVFDVVVEQVAEVVAVLPEDEAGERFCWVVRRLMERFPPGAQRRESYERVRAALGGRGGGEWKAGYSLWRSKPEVRGKLSRMLECPVCYERFVSPIGVCENGHCVCSKCKEQVKSCPICRAQFSSIRMTAMEQIMEASEFECKNWEAGCPVRLPYREIWEHEAECEYRSVSCDIVASRSVPSVLCNEDVVVAHFDEHMEKCHRALVAGFELNTEWRGEMRREKANKVRLLRNSSGSLKFIERIYVTEEEMFFSYHYVGRSEDARKYMYTVKIHGGGVLRKLRYSNICLPNYMGVFDTGVDERCIILEPNRIFDPQQNKFAYSVRIEDVNVYRMRLKRNKLMARD